MSCSYTIVKVRGSHLRIQLCPEALILVAPAFDVTVAINGLIGYIICELIIEVIYPFWNTCSQMCSNLGEYLVELDVAAHHMRDVIGWDCPPITTRRTPL